MLQDAPRSAFSDALVHIGCGIGSTLDLCTVPLVQLSIFAEVDSVNGSLLNSICSHFPLVSAIVQSDEKIIDMCLFVFFLTSVPLVKAVLAGLFTCSPAEA